MKHLTRDFLTLPGSSCPGTNMYALAIFLMVCGGYSVVGQTNFNLSTGSANVAHGVSASVYQVGTIIGGFGEEDPLQFVILSGVANVAIPSGTYQLSSADNNRILALRSQNNPRYNSGLFRITSVNTETNIAQVDYRAPVPATEEHNLDWHIFVDELTASTLWNSGSNGCSGYGSWSPTNGVSASASRIIMESPTDSSWQVRLCLESLHDVTGAVPVGFSIAPGFGGNATGDFLPILPPSPASGQRLFLHGAAHYDTTSSLYRGMTVGLTPVLRTSPTSSLWTQGQWRISMMVDDVSGTCAIINRNVSLPATATSGSGWAVFGVCEDETENPALGNVADPIVNCPRLFVVGSSNEASNVTWESQFHSDINMQVVGFSKRGYPIPGVLSCYSDILNTSAHTRYLTASADTPWMNATELTDVEVLVGTIDTTSSPTAEPLYPLQPRRLGRLPMFMQGRANVTSWSMTADSAYLHTQDGVFMEWGGPPMTGSITGSKYTVVKTTYEDHEGLVPYVAFHPGSDPFVEELPPWMTDVDATRFQKTYSYYRQVPVNVGFIKGGSNPSKP